VGSEVASNQYAIWRRYIPSSALIWNLTQLDPATQDKLFAIDTLCHNDLQEISLSSSKAKPIDQARGYWKTGEAGFRHSSMRPARRHWQFIDVQAVLLPTFLVSLYPYLGGHSSGASTSDPKVYVVQTSTKVSSAVSDDYRPRRPRA